MSYLSRRTLLGGFLSLSAVGSAFAQGAAPVPTPFRYEEVVRRARDLAGAPFAPRVPPLPEPLNRLDFDAYRDIRFRPERALLSSSGGSFRMHMLHLGFLYTRPVTVNVIRDG